MKYRKYENFFAKLYQCVRVSRRSRPPAVAIACRNQNDNGPNMSSQKWRVNIEGLFAWRDLLWLIMHRAGGLPRVVAHQ